MSDTWHISNAGFSSSTPLPFNNVSTLAFLQKKFEIPAEAEDVEVDIDREYEAWILLLGTVTCVWLFCLPCWCAGLPYRNARKFANFVQTRLPLFYTFITLVIVGLMGTILVVLPDWDAVSYLAALAKFLGWFASHVVRFAISALILVAFGLLYLSKDRIMSLLGMEHVTLCRFSWRDCLSCWSMNRFRVIEVRLVKVDDLPSKDMFNPNDVFVELHMGFNEPMRTRVHNNAGAGCLLGEVMQLNFDPTDSMEKLTLIVKNQELLSTSTIGQAEFNSETLREIISVDEAHQFRLHPKGKIWVDIKYLDEDGPPSNTFWFW